MTYSILEKMYSQNPWWEDHQLVSEDYHVKELKKVKFIFLNQEFLQHRFLDGVYIVTGPRQIGKTTHLKLLIQKLINKTNKDNFLYFNCDILDSKKDIAELVEGYLEKTKVSQTKYILLDEITSIKDSILGIKYLIDKGIKKNIIYILTGSSTVNIKKTGEFLPGRRGKGKDFLFLPVSFSDFLSCQYKEVDLAWSGKEKVENFYFRVKKKISLFEELDKYLTSGGIPRLINDFLISHEISLDSFQLYRDWIVSEIAKNGKREQIVKTILQRILSSLGSDLSYNSFASDTEISSHNTVYDYLNFLEDAFFIKQIYNFDYHKKKIQFRKNKKIYLRDSFFVWLLQWWLNGKFASYKQILKEPLLKTRLVENIVFLHLERMFKDIFFYREKEEIDFLYQNLAWECKYQSNIVLSDLKPILKFPGEKIIVTYDHFKIDHSLQFLPLPLFLLLPKEYFI